jgi:hypothetical protein
MTKLEELMRMIDEYADKYMIDKYRSDNPRAAVKSALQKVCTEIEVLRDAVESAYDFLDTMSSDPDCEDDGTQGAIRATRRQMAEALGKSLPRLLYEKREGQKLFGLRYRELAEENAHLRDALSKPVNGPGTAVDSRSAACSSSSVPRSQPSGIVSSGVVAPSRATHASPPEPENPAARRLTGEEVERILERHAGGCEWTDDQHDSAEILVRSTESALATIWGVKLP